MGTTEAAGESWWATSGGGRSADLDWGGGGGRRLWIGNAGVQSCRDEQAMPPRVKDPQGSCSCDGSVGDVWQTGRCSPCWDSDAASICCGKEGPELEDSLSIESHPDPNLCHRLWLVGWWPDEYDHKYKLPLRAGCQIRTPQSYSVFGHFI